MIEATGLDNLPNEGRRPLAADGSSNEQVEEPASGMPTGALQSALPDPYKPQALDIQKAYNLGSYISRLIDGPVLSGVPHFAITRPSPHELPHLSIPPHSPPRDLFQSETPETPASLSSPVVRVVDLTRDIQTSSETALAHGGFSDIYSGEWERKVITENGRVKVEMVKVAIKLLRILSNKDQDGVKARKRLNREVYVWHRLDHPHIARFFGTSYHMSGRPAMIMQWYKNGSATDYLKTKNPDADRIMLIRDVAQGLKYLHTLTPPIVHGDLKGNNILITDDGHAALSDFGLSQVIEALVGPTGITPSFDEIGPVRWQAPEFLQDEHCRPRLPTDVWSFGCTAYELLTSKFPYHYRHRDCMVIQDILAGVKPPGPGDTIEHKASNGVWDLLDDCWAFSPFERLPMTAVESRLEQICHS